MRKRTGHTAVSATQDRPLPSGPLDPANGARVKYCNSGNFNKIVAIKTSIFQAEPNI